MENPLFRGTLLQRAFRFAHISHAGQKRKYTGEPYIIHPRRVSFWVAAVTYDPEVVAAAILHDVLEDTSATFEELRDRFGWRVARMVWEVTDISRPNDGNRRVRKEIDRQHLALTSAEAQTIKLADLIDNTGSIVAHDPGFARVYMREKALLLEVLHRGSPALYAVAAGLVEEFERSYKR